MRLKGPSYKFNDFIGACAAGVSSVSVLKGAKLAAQTDFNLNTMSQIVTFIGAGGLESPTFQNTAPWENNPDPGDCIMVDAYGFYSGTTYGYIAFMFQPKTNKWIIKSFKKNDRQGPKYFPFGDLIGKITGGKK